MAFLSHSFVHLFRFFSYLARRQSPFPSDKVPSPSLITLSSVLRHDSAERTEVARKPASTRLNWLNISLV